MTFELTNRIAGLIMGALCITLLIAPGVIHWLFNIESGAGADIMSRRAAMLFAGMVVLVVASQTTASSEVQHLVSAAMLVTMLGLMLLGTIEYLRGAVGPGIALAILVEAFFAFFYHQFWRD